jgi:hypothetical protein
MHCQRFGQGSLACVEGQKRAPDFARAGRSQHQQLVGSFAQISSCSDETRAERPPYPLALVS